MAQFRYEKKNSYDQTFTEQQQKKILEFETFFPLSQKKNFQKNLLLFSSSLFSSEFLFRFSLQIISIQKTSHKKLPTTEKNLHKNYFFLFKIQPSLNRSFLLESPRS